MAYFVVTSEQGPEWVDGRPMRAQQWWAEHASFVNSGMSAGFIILGGPLGNGSPHRALLIVNAETESAARSQLLEDPWVRAGILRIRGLEPWSILVSNDKLDAVLAEITNSGAAP